MNYCTSMIQPFIYIYIAEYLPIDGRESLKNVGGLPQVINKSNCISVAGIYMINLIFNIF